MSITHAVAQDVQEKADITQHIELECAVIRTRALATLVSHALVQKVAVTSIAFRIAVGLKVVRMAHGI
jgi:hypothetical protein